MISPSKQTRKILVALIWTACFTFVWANSLNISQRLVDKVVAKFGAQVGLRVQDWGSLIQNNKQLDDKEKLKMVNDFFNQMEFTEDIANWGKQDYWATPLEFITKGAGDCEDFSIAKYFTLKELGVDDEKLKITYVKAIKINQAHMVLTYYEKPYSEPLVLDNLDKELKPGSQRMDLKPVYSFNGNGLWLAKERGRGKRVSDANKIDLWADVSERMARDLGN